MKIAVVGAGAIGGFMAARLAMAGEAVSVVDQGEHLHALQTGGLRLIEAGGREHVVVPQRACRSASELPTQDVVLLAVKAHVIADVAPTLGPVIGPNTVIVTLQNGIPWWYFQRHAGPWAGHSFERLDPGGIIADNIPVAKLVGCVVYPACSLVAPGLIRHVEGSRFPVGELDGRMSPRLACLADLFQRAGFKAPMLDDIRSEIWLKLWGSLSFNPISALTHATLVDIAQFPASRALVAAMMREAEVVASRLGVSFRVSLEHRIAGAEAVGAHKTSMLQDVEAGGELELEAILGAVAEIGVMTAVPTPSIDAIYGCASLLAETLARKQGRLRVECAAA